MKDVKMKDAQPSGQLQWNFQPIEDQHAIGNAVSTGCTISGPPIQFNKI
jgi:hypothetical protein